MIAVSNAFKNAMKQPVKELDGYISTTGHNITSSDDLVSIKISCESSLCKSSMRKLEAKYIGDYDLLNKWVNVGYGVKINNSYEYLDYGSFLITEITYSADTDTTTIVGYDKMINAMKPYIPLQLTYPINLLSYTIALCNACGLTLGNVSLPTMNNWLINGELWENINGITYRDIIVQIAQVTGSTAIISNDDKLYFKPITATNENLTYSNLIKLKLYPKYGPINSVILSRTPQEDNIFEQDTESIAEYGLTEWKIENNEIVDKDRDNALPDIYDAMNGIEFYPFEVNTEGLGWYEIADSIDIVNNSGDTFNIALFNYSITIDGGIKETLKTSAENKTQTQYQYASQIEKRIKNTEIITNKQEQYIQTLVSDMTELNGVVQENFTSIFQDINNVVTSVQNTGGSNLLKNSVMFAIQDGVPNSWNVSGSGSLTASSSAEAKNNGSISGNVFVLNDKTVKQRITVKKDSSDIPEDYKTYYSFSTKIKKGADGTCYVKISNSIEEYIISLAEGESSNYGSYDLSKLLPKDNYYDIEFYGSADSNVAFTDNMFALGSYASQWTQANGEIMNTQVIVDENGLLVKSSVYDGDYTTMNPLEFAGYSNVNGTIVKVFTLNKDLTDIFKLRVKEEITMNPIKIVPVSSTDKVGWAFVPSNDGGGI